MGIVIDHNARKRDIIAKAINLFAEQGYNGVSCAYDSSGSVTLTFYTAGRTRRETAALREYTLSAAIAVHDALWDSGAITWTCRWTC